MLSRLAMFKPIHIFRWLQRRAALTGSYDTMLSSFLITALFIAASVAMVVSGLGNPTGFGFVPDIIIYFVLNLLFFIVAGAILAYLFSLIYLPVPRLFFGSLLYTGFLSVYVLHLQNLGLVFSLVAGLSYTIGGLILGAVLYIIFHPEAKPVIKVLAVLVPSAAILTAFLVNDAGDNVRLSLEEMAMPEHITPIPAGNPGEPGDYDVISFTYGSGQDRHRPEFGEETDLLSASVDASEYIDRWTRDREHFWGFDETKLPLNGRVWMPDGEGPFPLLLMVHGNHRMENFSDGGYGYLGELLASRGFIAVSVDENFLNYTGWSGIPSRNYELRAWILLHHLLEIKDFNEMVSTPFFRKVNMDQVALMGHSRGGQAAAMAADHERWFSEDLSLQGIDEIGIEAVIALAPTDRRTDDMRSELHETYYLLLHGARDGDLHIFHGDRQYERTSFDEGSERFKASLYIGEANHSQFNTDWGRSDMSLPGGIFTNRDNLLEPEEQQEIAKVYISAFMGAVFHGREDYINLFRDYRSGAHWLPDTQYMSRFENGKFLSLTPFRRNESKTEFPDDVTVEAEGFTEWEIEAAEDRRGNSKNTDGVVLEWKNDPSSDSLYSVHLSESFLENLNDAEPESIWISMADMSLETERAEEMAEAGYFIEIEVATLDGTSVRLPFDDFMPVKPQIKTHYTKFGVMDEYFRDGKYEEQAEIAFQTHEFPFHVFEEANEDFQRDELARITLHFYEGPGRVIIEDFGFISVP
ncbi:alpha/beta hydrolase [Evansella sp. LMS18]|uniref:alpha/beta hydrolase n=1 Tax=Evansella sp. LMS18 TaxID=2924033 RepID=UPI0020D0175D|nr:alpha/beta hydrolase [Evansella sp. LMS18]UTR10639.1 alpha/beta hydrolase [Evansella sp. LMS18]